MLLGQLIEAAAIVDRADRGGEVLKAHLARHGFIDLEVVRLSGERGATDFVRARFPGREGKTSGGPAPTLGIIGRLGAAGNRPAAIGMVSDADGALVAVTLMLKLVAMQAAGDGLDGDVVVATHLCPAGVSTPSGYARQCRLGEQAARCVDVAPVLGGVIDTDILVAERCGLGAGQRV